MSEEKKRNYPEFDEKGKVICQICGKAFMILTPSHLYTHDGIKYAEYNKMFPDAPITNEEFKALSKYSKPRKYTEEDIKILGTEKIIDEDIPEIDDEFELPKTQIEKFSTPMEAKKNEIFRFLVDYFPNIKVDHKIEIFDMQGCLVFSTISDYADDFLKINVQFPDTFWHNMDAVGDDPNRKRKLESFGWKVIEVKSLSPTIKSIEKEIRKII